MSFKFKSLINIQPNNLFTYSEVFYKIHYAIIFKINYERTTMYCLLLRLKTIIKNFKIPLYKKLTNKIKISYFSKHC